MQLNDMYASLPGMTTATETYESAFRWGQYGVGIITSAQISSAATDAGNTPTWELRPGLVLGQITSSGQWTAYSATATDGSQVAAGVLMEGLRMQDLLGNTVARFFGVLVGGPIRGSVLFGLDSMARNQMRGKFIFDDDLPGNSWYPTKTQVAKTAAYTILPGDNGTEFTNTGASGSVTFTLPAIANGLSFSFYGIADQPIQVSSAEGTNVATINNASASSVAFSTSSQKIGSAFQVYSNPAGTKWLVRNMSSNTMTVA